MKTNRASRIWCQCVCIHSFGQEWLDSRHFYFLLQQTKLSIGVDLLHLWEPIIWLLFLLRSLPESGLCRMCITWPSCWRYRRAGTDGERDRNLVGHASNMWPAHVSKRRRAQGRVGIQISDPPISQLTDLSCTHIGYNHALLQHCRSVWMRVCVYVREREFVCHEVVYITAFFLTV